MEWKRRYALVLIAIYNGSDLVGRYAPLVESIKVTSRRGMLAAVLARYLLLPAFYCAARYGGEAWMIALVSALGLNNGYLTVCVLTEAPRPYKVSLASVAQSFHTSCNTLVFFF